MKYWWLIKSSTIAINTISSIHVFSILCRMIVINYIFFNLLLHLPTMPVRKVKLYCSKVISMVLKMRTSANNWKTNYHNIFHLVILVIQYLLFKLYFYLVLLNQDQFQKIFQVHHMLQAPSGELKKNCLVVSLYSVSLKQYKFSQKIFLIRLLINELYLLCKF